MSKRTIFISQSIESQHELKMICEQYNWTLIAESLIDFKSINFVLPIVKTDVIFFTSPRSVQYFFERTRPKDQKIACIGEATKRFAEKQGVSVDFCGENSQNPILCAKQFSLWLGDKTVLFPQSTLSKKTFQAGLKKEQLFELTIYETILSPKKIELQPEILIFSSPSNVDAFLSMNEINAQQTVFSWGTTTQQHLQGKGISSEFYSIESVNLLLKTQSIK